MINSFGHPDLSLWICGVRSEYKSSLERFSVTLSLFLRVVRPGTHRMIAGARWAVRGRLTMSGKSCKNLVRRSPQLFSMSEPGAVRRSRIVGIFFVIVLCLHRHESHRTSKIVPASHAEIGNKIQRGAV